MLRRPAAPWTAALLAALLVCQLAIRCLGSSELQSSRVQALAGRTSSRRALLQVQPASSDATSPGPDSGAAAALRLTPFQTPVPDVALLAPVEAALAPVDAASGPAEAAPVPVIAANALQHSKASVPALGPSQHAELDRMGGLGRGIPRSAPALAPESNLMYMPAQMSDSTPMPALQSPWYNATKKHAFPLIPSRGAFENGTVYTQDAYTSTQVSYVRPSPSTPPPSASAAPARAPTSTNSDISLLSFRTQFIVAGPGLVPWQYDTAFIAGMSDYLGIDSGVGNLTIKNWAEVNLANFPEVPALLSLPQGTVGNPIWLIMTGVTTGIQGYNRLISKIVPLTAAARSVDLIPFMVANGLNVSRVFLYNLDYGPTSQVPQYAPSPPAAPSVQVPGPNPRAPPQDASALAPAPAPTPAVPLAGAAVADEPGDYTPPQQAAAQAAGPQSNAALLGGVAGGGALALILAGLACVIYARMRRRMSWSDRASKNGFDPRQSGSAEPLSQRRSEEGLAKAWASPSRAPGGGIFGERSLLSRSSTLGMVGMLGAKGTSRGEPWEIDPAEIKIMQRSDGGPWVLGEGASSSVYKAQWRVQTVAVKMLSNTTAKQMEAFQREALILEDLKDTNIVQFMGACFEDNGDSMLVTEFMAGGNLFDAIGNDREGKLSWYQRGRKIAMDVARGLDKMHSRHIIHLDLKSPNILLTAGDTAKIADVGLSKILVNESTMMTSFQGTFEWAPPELINGGECSEKADIYSFGVILWEIVTAERPYRKQFRAARLPEECPEEIAALIKDCLSADPEQRPSSTAIFHVLQQQAALAPLQSGSSALTPQHSLSAPTNSSGHPSPALSADEADGYAGARHHRGTVAELLPDMPKLSLSPGMSVGDRPPGLPRRPSRLPGPLGSSEAASNGSFSREEAFRLKGHSSAEMATPARPTMGKRVSFRDDSPPSRATEDSAMLPGPKPQWVSENSRRKKLRLNGAGHVPPSSGAPSAPGEADVSASRDNGHDENAGPPVPRSYFSPPGQEDDWAIDDESGPPVPKSSFA